MKTIHLIKPIAFTLLIFTILISACKKDTKAITIKGTWEGTYIQTGDDTNYYLSFKITEGVLDVMSNEVDKTAITGSGTWTLEGSKFLAYIDISGVNYTYTAQFDIKTGLFTNGTWGKEANETDGGTWTMTKQ